VPYLAIIDTRLTPGVQTGFYIGYLFKADGSGVYRSLNQGTTETEEDIQLTKNRLRYDVPGLANWGEFDIDLVANKNSAGLCKKPTSSLAITRLTICPAKPYCKKTCKT
jgi:hypothetical protein